MGYAQQIALARGLNPKHKQLVREIAGGATPAQAGERIGYTMKRVRQIMASVIFKEALEKMENEIDEKVKSSIAHDAVSVAKILLDAAPDAARGLVALSKKGKDARLKFNAKKDILDRTGHKAPDETVVSLSIDADEGLKYMLGKMVEEAENAKTE